MSFYCTQKDVNNDAETDPTPNPEKTTTECDNMPYATA